MRWRQGSGEVMHVRPECLLHAQFEAHRAQTEAAAAAAATAAAAVTAPHQSVMEYVKVSSAGVDRLGRVVYTKSPASFICSSSSSSSSRGYTQQTSVATNGLEYNVALCAQPTTVQHDAMIVAIQHQQQGIKAEGSDANDHCWVTTSSDRRHRCWHVPAGCPWWCW
jgi:hypothetical protein